MAPPHEARDLVARFGCGYGYYYSGGGCLRSSNFYFWGRWVLIGVIILAILALLVICSCVARRRRRRGVQPVYGTGWLAPTGKWGAHNANSHQMNNYGYNQGGGGYGPGYNQGGYNNSANPPPAYGQQQPQYTGTTLNPNDGYYGGNQYSGIQPPNSSYQRDAYPPPSK